MIFRGEVRIGVDEGLWLFPECVGGYLSRGVECIYRGW